MKSLSALMFYLLSKKMDSKTRETILAAIPKMDFYFVKSLRKSGDYSIFISKSDSYLFPWEIYYKSEEGSYIYNIFFTSQIVTEIQDRIQEIVDEEYL